jgi:hypothetical protein
MIRSSPCATAVTGTHLNCCRAHQGGNGSARHAGCTQPRGATNEALVAGESKRPGLRGTGQLTRNSMIRPQDLLENGAVINVMRLRQIGRVEHHAVRIEGNSGGFASGRFD